MKQTITQTIETRIPATLCVQVDAALFAMSQCYSRVKHTLVARKNRNQTTKKPEAQVEFGITGRQFNAIKGEVDGLFQGQLSNYERYIVEANIKIVNRLTRIAEIPTEIANAFFIEKEETRQLVLFKLHRELEGCKDRNNRAKYKIEEWQRLLNAKQISACFGSKKLWYKQFELTKNNLADHAEWYAKFSKKRADEFTALGSKDETTGNQSCTIKDRLQNYLRFCFQNSQSFKDRLQSYLSFYFQNNQLFKVF